MDVNSVRIILYKSFVNLIMVTNEIDVDGNWWFPNSDIKFNGKLVFNKESGGYLTIFGSFEPFALLDISQNQNTESRVESKNEKICKKRQEKLIYGETKEKKKITLLYDLSPSKNSEFRPKYTYEERTYKIRLIFIGFHFENVEQIQFESIIIEFSNLPYWIRDQRMIGSTFHHLSKNPNKYIIEHTYGETINVDIDNECNIQFFNYPIINEDLVTSKKVQNCTYVKITSNKIKTLKKYHILKNILQDFFNFATTRDVRSLRFLGHHKVIVNKHEYVELVEIFYRSSISKKMDKLGVIQNDLLRFEELDQKFFDVLKLWFTLGRKIGATYDLYFGVMYNHELYLSNKFLMLAEALEILMGILINNNTDNDLRLRAKRIDAIFEKLDKCKEAQGCELTLEDNDWIKRIMNDKRGLSFREKMEKAYDNYSEILPELSSVIGSKQEFASTIVKTRNKLTHGNIDYDKVDVEELFWNTENLQLILQLSILSQLGFTKTDLKEIYLIDETE
jgi:hypothetical protein